MWDDAFNESKKSGCCKEKSKDIHEKIKIFEERGKVEKNEEKEEKNRKEDEFNEEEFIKLKRKVSGLEERLEKAESIIDEILKSI